MKTWPIKGLTTDATYYTHVILIHHLVSFGSRLYRQTVLEQDACPVKLSGIRDSTTTVLAKVLVERRNIRYSRQSWALGARTIRSDFVAPNRTATGRVGL